MKCVNFSAGLVFKRSSTDLLDSVSFVATNPGPASVALTVSDLAGNSQIVTYNFNVV
ncbi:MAG: hypothetical protein ACKODW_02380 [Methylophilaceae bacterium]